MDYLPETEHEFGGPRDAAAWWWPLVRRAPWVQKPKAVLFAQMAISLAAAKRARTLFNL
jgi:hypothetical protein